MEAITINKVVFETIGGNSFIERYVSVSKYFLSKKEVVNHYYKLFMEKFGIDAEYSSFLNFI